MNACNQALMDNMKTQLDNNKQLINYYTSRRQLYNTYQSFTPQLLASQQATAAQPYNPGFYVATNSDGSTYYNNVPNFDTLVQNNDYKLVVMSEIGGEPSNNETAWYNYVTNYGKCQPTDWLDASNVNCGANCTENNWVSGVCPLNRAYYSVNGSSACSNILPTDPKFTQSFTAYRGQLICCNDTPCGGGWTGNCNSNFGGWGACCKCCAQGKTTTCPGITPNNTPDPIYNTTINSKVTTNSLCPTNDILNISGCGYNWSKLGTNLSSIQAANSPTPALNVLGVPTSPFSNIANGSNCPGICGWGGVSYA